MIQAPALQFTLISSDEPERKVSVHSDTARVGSGAHCEVRLAPQDAAFEQLQLWARAGGIFGEARCLEPPALLSGSPFVQGRLLPDSVLRVGRVELRVALVERHAGARAEKASRNGRRLLYALGGIGIPLGILCAGPRLGGDAPEWNLEPQRLWVEPEPALCPSDRAGAEAVLARQMQRQAESARERAPFNPGDGVHAVELFARAAACYAQAGSEALSNDMAAAAGALKLELERQFHVHQVRLERALDRGHYYQAKQETRILLSFASRRAGPYFDWLSTLDRQIDVKFSGSKS